jgi:hypothetical protein
VSDSDLTDREIRDIARKTSQACPCCGSALIFQMRCDLPAPVKEFLEQVFDPNNPVMPVKLFPVETWEEAAREYREIFDAESIRGGS